MRLSDIASSRVGLLGFGAEGRATLDALRRVGVERSSTRPRAIEAVILVDAPLSDSAGLESVRGEDAVARARRVDVLVKSPGVKPTHAALVAAREAGVAITTATNLALAELRAAGLPVLGVTGSKGKSTTTSLAHGALKAAGRECALVGNIGAPALDALDDIVARRAITCFELSSYQCHDLDAGTDVAVLLNLFPEHMDWHGSVAAYYDAKCRLPALQREEALTIFDAESVEIARRLSGSARGALGPARHVGFGVAPAARFVPRQAGSADGAFWRGDERLFDDSRMTLRGLHNRRNACAALEAALAVGAEPRHVEEALASFAGLPHRLEEVPGRGGIRFVDDSISTAPEAAVAALEAFRGSVSTLIAGGHDRGYDFAPLVDAIVAEPVSTVICLPPSGLRLAADLRARGGAVKVIECADLEEAVAAALRETPAGRTCLFSPASPSYGAFRDFHERGLRFQSLIR